MSLDQFISKTDDIALQIVTYVYQIETNPILQKQVLLLCSRMMVNTNAQHGSLFCIISDSFHKYLSIINLQFLITVRKY